MTKQQTEAHELGIFKTGAWRLPSCLLQECKKDGSGVQRRWVLVSMAHDCFQAPLQFFVDLKKIRCSNLIKCAATATTIHVFLTIIISIIICVYLRHLHGNINRYPLDRSLSNINMHTPMIMSINTNQIDQSSLPALIIENLIWSLPAFRGMFYPSELNRS